MLETTDCNRLLQGDIAKLLDITVNTIYTWERKNDFDPEIGPFPASEREGRTKLYKWKPVLAWFIKYKAFTQYHDALMGQNPDGVNFEEWKAREKKANALMAERNLALDLDQVISTEEAEKKWATTAEKIKAKLLTVPSRCGALLHDGQTAAEREDALDTEIRMVLQELAGL